MIRATMFTASMFFTACMAQHQQQSQVLHDLGRTLNDESSYQWLDTSTDQYVKNILSVSPALLLPTDHPATKRLQFWVDLIDGKLRARDARGLAGVPKPMANIILDPEINAFVAPIGVCLDLNILVGGVAPSNGAAGSNDVAQNSRMFFNRNQGSFSSSSPGCVPSTLSADEQVKMLQWELSSLPNCPYTVSGKTINLPLGCLGPNSDVKPGQKASTVTVQAVSNQITVQSAMMAALSEEETVSLVAHEMGHYYMAHLIAPSNLYDFYYNQGDSNPKSKPNADPAAASQGLQLQNAINNAILTDHFAVVPQRKLNYVVFQVLNDLYPTLAEQKCLNPPCPTSCGQLRNFMTSSKLYELKMIPIEIKPYDYELKSFAEFQNLALQCATDTEVGDGPMQLPPSQVLASLRKVTSNDDFVQDLQPLPDAKTLADLLLYLTNDGVPKAITANLARLNAMYAQAINNRLGLYTIEQEADELSSEWTTLIGLDPQALVQALIAFAQIPMTRPPYPGEILGNDCLDLYKRHWLDQAGNPVVVPVANWSDIHHSACYRAFNADREIKTFGLRKTAGNAPTAPGKPWSELALDLKAALANSSAAPGGP